MSHLYRYFKDGILVAASTPGATRMREPEHAPGQVGTFAGDTSYGGSASGVVVLKPTLTALPVARVPDDMFQETIVPSPIAQPTAVLMGGHLNGGYGEPWTAGPVSLASIHVPLGSMLFCIGDTVAISLGIGGESDLFSQALVNYHRRGVTLKIHTGIGTARGGASRDPSGGNAVVPYGKPLPPSNPPRREIGPTITVPGLGPLEIPPEEHDSGMHQHPGSSCLDRWKEDFGALWNGLSEWPSWVF